MLGPGLADGATDIAHVRDGVHDAREAVLRRGAGGARALARRPVHWSVGRVAPPRAARARGHVACVHLLVQTIIVSHVKLQARQEEILAFLGVGSFRELLSNLSYTQTKHTELKAWQLLTNLRS